MRPTDTITSGFLALLFTISLIFNKRIPEAHIILSIYIFLFIALFSLILLKKRQNGKIIETIYDIVFPVIAVLLIFDSLGGLIRYINPRTYDHILIQIDYIIFGTHPTLFLEQFIHPVFTEILQLAYTSYYFLPLILGIILKVRRKNAEFDRSIFLILLCFFLSYIGYILVPAIGPRYTMNHLQNTELDGILLRNIIDGTLTRLEGIKRDAFPSGHTAVTLVILSLAYRFQKSLFWIFLPVVIALLISTVYLRYHYVIDVMGGIILFAFTVFIGEKYYNWWYRNKNAKS
jgi:membrane-associated phospholipid phosphatase